MAFLIYKKCSRNIDAKGTFLTNIETLERAQEFAAFETRLVNNLISGAINSYLSSEDPTNISEGIQAANREDHVVGLTRYLLRART